MQETKDFNTYGNANINKSSIIQGLSNNQYSIILLGFAIGGYCGRSTLYEYLQNRNISMTIIQVAFVGSYLFQQYHSDFETKKAVFFEYDNLIMMLIMSILVGIPAGSIYSVALIRVFDTQPVVERQSMSSEPFDDNSKVHLNENEKELAVNWILNMMDLGSFLA